MSSTATLTDVEILLAQPRGFCAGVDRAIEIVERAIKLFGAPIYVRHEIVHNAYVVEDLRKKGAVFIEDLADAPYGSTLIFSAHGVSKAVRAEADTRGLRVFDAERVPDHGGLLRVDACHVVGPHVARPGLPVEDALRNAPERRGNLFVVPKVVE